MAENENKAVGGTIARRELVTAIILSIVTCGIYGIYWFITISEDVNTLTDDHTTSGGMAFVLTLVTCGIYGYFWVYKLGKRLYEYQKARGEEASDNSILYVVLQFFGLGIVTYALIQDTLNNYAA
jgi:ABC-type Mn2+/Zn2+ transport system permease subunit